MEPDFIIVACGNSLPHEPHEWREGFLNLRKRRCGGKPHIRKSNWEKANPAITNNRVLAETISKPHKHSMYFDGVSFGRLIFKCSECPNRIYPYEIRVDRWKWNEWTRNLPKADQTWPE